MSSPFRILIVDDEADILDFLQYNLNREGYETATAEDGREAIRKAKELRPHLILLDIMMPEMDGIEVCRELRASPEYKHTVIAFLTARGEDYSQVAGFDAGADDYIVKPIKPRVLMSRVKALLKRFNDEPVDSKISVGEIEIDKEQYLVRKNNREFILPKKEFELLLLLASRPGKVFSRREILSKVWGTDIIVGDRTIDVHIRKLREKLGEKNFKTIKGVGYKFDL
ncbi:MAG TPA: response regulator transcription factor [Chitinophagales bacterium]|nr:response regulator transcription factor [Chitinophagales bacterium]